MGKDDPFLHLPSRMLYILLLLPISRISCLRDDWFGFASFEETSEWATSYDFTCNYNYDTFREPRETSQRNWLRGRRELHTPIRFRSKDCLKSKENFTLHIYNNPGIRRGHSVSYGFQRNKECLHGQDSDCFVFPETGKIRAVVLNADRFPSKRQNLNYIKDNFLIEKQERFTTIINGGSTFERKFYEAVFLGGYCSEQQRYRSSHQIDGKTYPLEIYMYFLDETVPSVSLSTILVVLVEESEKDNTQIKPIISAVESKLYNSERRFLVEHKALIRRQRLFHNLQASTFYDVYDFESLLDGKKDPFKVQESLDTSVQHEAYFTQYVEPFEKMEALEAELFFLYEDLENVNEKLATNKERVNEFNTRSGNLFFPYNFSEYHCITHVAVGKTFANFKSLRNKTCAEAADYFIRSGGYFKSIHGAWFINLTIQAFPKDKDHIDEFVNLAALVCDYFVDYQRLFLMNKNDTLMESLSLDEKYEIILLHRKARLKRDQLELLMYRHFHESPQFHNYSNLSQEVPDYANPSHKKRVVEGMLELVLSREKKNDYQKINDELQKRVEENVEKLDYTNEDEMKDVIRYLKFGNKENDLKYSREKVHDDFVHRVLPEQQKKRTLVELGGMEMNEYDMLEIEDTDPTSTPVEDAFQISWLLPPGGGYYFYQGSSPIPPCFRAENVIVFRKPITMSRRQIKVLTRIPTSFDKKQDIVCTTPISRATKFSVELSSYDTDKSRLEEIRVPVYLQKRNHLFLGHDGVHKNSVNEWEKYENAKNVAATWSVVGVRRISIFIVMAITLPII